MRGRLGVLIGFAAGYVLGSKAGQERYEEIRDAFNKLMGTEPAQQLQAEVRNAADKATTLVEEKTSQTIQKAGEKVDEVVNSKGGGDTSQSDTPDTAPSTGIAGPPPGATLP